MNLHITGNAAMEEALLGLNWCISKGVKLENGIDLLALLNRCLIRGDGENLQKTTNDEVFHVIISILFSIY